MCCPAHNFFWFNGFNRGPIEIPGVYFRFNFRVFLFSIFRGCESKKPNSSERKPKAPHTTTILWIERKRSRSIEQQQTNKKKRKKHLKIKWNKILSMSVVERRFLFLQPAIWHVNDVCPTKCGIIANTREQLERDIWYYNIIILKGGEGKGGVVKVVVKVKVTQHGGWRRKRKEKWLAFDSDVSVLCVCV